MIKPRFIDAQVQKSRRAKQTTPFLHRLVAATVDQVARAHYGDAYPTKCIQASIAVQRLLRRLRITLQVWLGAVCAAEVFESTYVAGWGGHHHVWTTTEFHELVDLTAAGMTRYPPIIPSGRHLDVAALVGLHQPMAAGAALPPRQRGRALLPQTLQHGRS